MKFQTQTLNKNASAFCTYRPLPSRSTITSCRASSHQSESTAEEFNRRALISGVLGISALASLQPTWAVLPRDDDEEDLIAEGRQPAKKLTRMAEERRKVRELLLKEENTGYAKNSYGLSAGIERELKPVVSALEGLQAAGADLKAGKIEEVKKGVKSWQENLKYGVENNSLSTEQLLQYEQVVKRVDGLAEAVKSGDLTASKKQYIKLARSVQSWTASAGVKAYLRPL